MIDRNIINKFPFKIFFINLFIFAIITTVFINFTHQTNKKFSQLNFENTNNNRQEVSKSNKDFKINVSKKLASKENYQTYLDRDCKITGSAEDRKKVRWLFQTLTYKTYSSLININELFPYYFQILFFSLIIYLTYFTIFKTFPIDNKYKYLFLFFITFIFQNPIGEFHFSVLEMLFIALALLASKNKNFLFFFVIILLSTLNRESGIIISLTWFIFNSEIKKFIYTIGATALFFILINFDILSCLINPKFFVLAESEVDYAQFSFKEIGKSIGYLSSIKVLFINFIIPFGFCFYIYLTTDNKNNFILYILLIYLFVFLFALPAQHLSSRLILLPIIFTFIYFKSKNVKKSI